jgi:hypothetical protein
MAVSMNSSADCPRNTPLRLFRIFTLLIVGILSLPRIQSQEQAMSNFSQPAVQTSAPAWMNTTNQKLEAELIKKYGEGQRVRVQRGLLQVSEFWRAEDGDAALFEEFITTNFAGDPATLDTMFNRFEHLLEELSGHMHEINREFRQQMDLDLGPVLPFDQTFAGYDPSAHLLDDFFQNKLAFTVLLNSAYDLG